MTAQFNVCVSHKRITRTDGVVRDKYFRYNSLEEILSMEEKGDVSLTFISCNLCKTKDVQEEKR